jgi:hypothetical protein
MMVSWALSQIGVQQRMQQSRERQVPAGDCLTVLAEIRRAKSRFGLPAAARVGGRRCATYAWIHRRTGGESALWL